MRRATLHVRLFVTYVAVAAIGAVTLLVATRVLAPAVFDHRIASAGLAARRGPAGQGPALRAAFASALNNALVVAFLVSVIAAMIAAVLVGRRLLRPLDAIRAGTRRLAEGNYDERVPVAGEPELAALALDVNGLAATLADTETRRARLIGDVAHELRTPLTTIQGYVEGVADALFTVDEALPRINAELDRLRRLAGDLALVSRVEEQAAAIERVDVDIAAIVRDVADRLRAQFAERSVHLDVTASSPAHVRGDGQRLDQAVTNLVSNALAYTPAGGHVDISVRAERDVAAVTVADTGIGLAPDDLTRVFDRFYRAGGAHSAGTGIGLTIARSIVRAHGGDVTATSEGPGTGSTFTLTVPLAAGGVRAPAPPA